MNEHQPTDSTTDVMRHWVGLLRQLGEDVCSWMAVVEAMQRRIAELEAMLGRITTTNRELLDESDRDRAVIEQLKSLNERQREEIRALQRLAERLTMGHTHV